MLVDYLVQASFDLIQVSPDLAQVSSHLVQEFHRSFVEVSLKSRLVEVSFRSKTRLVEVSSRPSLASPRPSLVSSKLRIAKVSSKFRLAQVPLKSHLFHPNAYLTITIPSRNATIFDKTMLINLLTFCIYIRVLLQVGLKRIYIKLHIFTDSNRSWHKT